MADTHEPAIAGWAGLLVPYDQPSVDGRVVRRPPGGARWRQLPLELKYQQAATNGHDGATIGLASITKVWETDEGLWGSGPFDLADPRGAELARKVHEGFVGHVSVDLGDFATRVERTDGAQVEAVTDWKLLSTTIVADAAMDGARIFSVQGEDDIVPMSTSMAARREMAGVFATIDRATVTFARQRTPDKDDETGQFAPALTLAVTAATNLPWAPRDRPWDAAAAQRRMAAHCGGRDNLNPQCFGRGFLYRNSDEDPTLLGSYKLPFADVIDGRVYAVFRGLASAAAYVDRAGITSADKEAVRSRMRTLYTSAAKAFNDDTITAPFSGAHHRRVAMADESTPNSATGATGDVPGTDTGAQVTALAESIVNELTPDLAQKLSDAILAAITQIVDGISPNSPVWQDETGSAMVDELPQEVTDEPAAAMSAAVLRFAKAYAAHESARRVKQGGARHGVR